MSLIEMVGYAVGVAVVFFAIVGFTAGILIFQASRYANQLTRRVDELK